MVSGMLEMPPGIRAKRKRQAPEDEPKVLSGCGEDSVDLIADCAEKVASAKPAIVFGMADHWLDRGTPFQFAFYGQRETAFVAGEHDLGLAVIVVSPIEHGIKPAKRTNPCRMPMIASRRSRFTE